MKARIHRKTLADAIARVSAVIPARPIYPTLAAIELSASGDVLRLRGTDADRTLIETLPAEVNDEGTVYISGHRLKQFVSASTAATVDILLDGSAAVIRAGRSEYRAQLMTEAEFPVEPASLPASGSVDVDEFTDAIARVKHALPALADPGAGDMGGLVIRSDGEQLLLMGTDRFRLAVAPIAYDGEPIAARFDLSLAVAAAKGASGPRLAVAVGVTGISFTTDESASVGRIADLAKYPDLVRYRDRLSGPLLTVDRDALIAAVRQAAPSGEKEVGVYLDVHADHVTVSAHDSEGAIEVEIDAECEDERRILLNPGYLLDALGAVNEGEVSMTLPPSNQAGAVLVTHPDVDGFQVVMSKRITR